MNKFIYQGVEYTRESFAAEFNVHESVVDEIIDGLIEKGLAREVEELSPLDKFIRDNEPKNRTHRQAEEIRDDEAEFITRSREERTKDSPKYNKGVNFDFDNVYDAVDFTTAVINKGIPAENVIATNAGLRVTVYDITEIELKQLALLYKTKKYTAKTTRGVNKVVKAGTNVIGYTAEHIALPIFNTGCRAAGDLAKTIIGTAKRAGKAAISATANTIRETKSDLRDDPTIIKGKDDFEYIKDSVKETFNFGTHDSGISFN